MKISIAHDYLNQFGGAERVLDSFLRIFPGSDIYTLFYDEETLGGRYKRLIKKTSFLDTAFVRKNHRYFIPFMPLAARSVAIESDNDLVILNSVGFAKGFKKSRRTKSIFYCNAMLRYAWDPETHLKDFLPKYVLPFAYPMAWLLRKWDKYTALSADKIIANSEYTQERIKRFYGIDAEVIYPPVDDIFFSEEPAEPKDYYFAAGRLIPYKKFDMIVEAFNELKLPLKIAGAGREEERLKKMATSSLIEFIGEVNDKKELRKLYAEAKGYIFPQIEDFGLVAAESLACGTPVIGFNAAGAKEMITDGMNGVLFDKQTPASLAEAVRRFEKLDFNRNEIKKSAEKFSENNFGRAMFKAILPLVK